MVLCSMFVSDTLAALTNDTLRAGEHFTSSWRRFSGTVRNRDRGHLPSGICFLPIMIVCISGGIDGISMAGSNVTQPQGKRSLTSP
jgi:hypothetical protein